MRLSIDVTQEQHQRLKAMAALQSKSIKSYVLDRVLPDTLISDDTEALKELETLLESRIKASQGKTINKSVKQIFEATHLEIQ